MRRHWLDNLRWFTVLLVLLYHVIYIFNSKGVFGGLGSFTDNPQGQPQDIVMYILYPWIMMLMFLLAGISARYSLERRTAKDFLRSRTQKLLVPGTVGLLVFHWITGYFNTKAAGASLPDMPAVVRWIVYAISGCGPLWFVQDLWLFSVVLLLVRKFDPNDRYRDLCSRASVPAIILLGVLVYLGSQCIIQNPRQNTADGLVNLYKPLTYLVPFLMGYFVFSNDSVQIKVKNMSVPMSVCALLACAVLCWKGWGMDMTAPEYLSGWLNCLYAWLMMLAMMGLFIRFLDFSNRFCSCMTSASYGLYVLHYSVLISSGYMLKTCTMLAPWLIYTISFLAVFGLTPLLYALLSRTPFIRCAVLGHKEER